MDYKVVDVFTSEVFKGNPVAVVLDGAHLSTAEMQEIARWTNLSETTFIVPKTHPEADYHVRIFSPGHELPFAGHPSLGTAHALLECGLVERKPSLIQQCKRGNIEILAGENGLQFGIDEITTDNIPLADLQECLEGLTIKGQPLIVNAGPRWVVVEVTGDENELLSYEPNFSKITDLSKHHNVSGICVFSPHSSNLDSSIELRTFAPIVSVYEDPVCGSGNAAVAFYRDLGRAYQSFQGSAIQRNGRISLDYKHGKIWVGGTCITAIDGKIRK